MVSLMDAARRGVTTEEIKAVASEENVSPDWLRKQVAEGLAIIASNKGRRGGKPIGIGAGLRTKVNANVGTSPDICDLKLEVEKAKVAVKYGADTVMDLSTEGDLDLIRKSIMDAVDAPLGTVPIYQAYVESVRKYRSPVHMSEDEVFKVIERHIKDGVAFMTLHCGITKEAVEHTLKHPRLTGIVSRGGVFLASWMLHNEKENPLYSNFSYLLELASENDVVLSLGDALRPGSLKDATDYPQLHELLTISRLVEQAWSKGVQVMVEGPGHLPLNQIEANVRAQKALCKGAPFYVLGPLVVDIASGYDHITGAIGGAIAAMAGADYICYVTPAEHLGLPTIEDVRVGVVASRIAAHAADIVKLGDKALLQDVEASEARATLDWKKQLELTLDPDRAREIHGRVKSRSRACTMCGDWCVFSILERYRKKIGS